MLVLLQTCIKLAMACTLSVGLLLFLQLPCKQVKVKAPALLNHSSLPLTNESPRPGRLSFDGALRPDPMRTHCAGHGPRPHAPEATNAMWVRRVPAPTLQRPVGKRKRGPEVGGAADSPLWVGPADCWLLAHSQPVDWTGAKLPTGPCKHTHASGSRGERDKAVWVGPGLYARNARPRRERRTTTAPVRETKSMFGFYNPEFVSPGVGREGLIWLRATKPCKPYGCQSYFSPGAGWSWFLVSSQWTIVKSQDDQTVQVITLA